jgi:diketogulonate reductase-like aldo/keto reductase
MGTIHGLRASSQENARAAEVELTADDLAQIDEASAQLEIQGARYNEAAQTMIDR